MIIVYEPECRGFAHEQVNAAIIKSLLEIYSSVVFFADKDHADSVISIINSKNITQKLTVIETSIPKRGSIFLKQLFLHNRIIKSIYSYAIKNDIKDIIYLSVNEVNLITFKLFARIYRKINVQIFVHGILEALTSNSINIFDYKVLFKLFFKLKRPANLNYTVFSPHIIENIEKNYKSLADQISSVYHPYIYKEREINSELNPLDNKHLETKFAVIGAFHMFKGADNIIEIANKIATKNCSAKIDVIGYNQLEEICPPNIISQNSSRRLTTKEMHDLSEKTDYFIFAYPENMYNYMASGALFDAFYYSKPIIALKHPMFEYYFKKLGNIGYLCDNLDDMENRIIELYNHHDKHYSTQVENIIKIKNDIFIPNNSDFFQKRFSPRYNHNSRNDK